jgi:hypothetical protein
MQSLYFECCAEPLLNDVFFIAFRAFSVLVFVLIKYHNHGKIFDMFAKSYIAIYKKSTLHIALLSNLYVCIFFTGASWR